MTKNIGCYVTECWTETQLFFISLHVEMIQTTEHNFCMCLVMSDKNKQLQFTQCVKRHQTDITDINVLSQKHIFVYFQPLKVQTADWMFRECKSLIWLWWGSTPCGVRVQMICVMCSPGHSVPAMCDQINKQPPHLSYYLQ